jgi:transposase InsO family protein
LTDAVVALAPVSGMTAAVCAAVGVSRATMERKRARRRVPLAAPPAIARPRPAPPSFACSVARALTAQQQKAGLDLLHAPRFADQAAKRTDAATSGQRAQAPAEIYATLLDEGVYHGSIRTIYRILGQNGEVRERRQQRRHPVYQKPERLAEKPHEVWSWDITKLMGPSKGSYFYLYVILDIFSRRVVGWCVADAETATLFKPLFDDAIEKHNVPPGQLTLHADRGGPMKAKATAFLLADLGVTRSHNRPHTSSPCFGELARANETRSNDNPFSESHFKTLKYQPGFPKRFGCIEDARSFCRAFFDWYNQDHHHCGIGLMTPDQVHYGQIDAVHAARQVTLGQAFGANPERFVKKPPVPPAKPTATWINPPTLKKPA